MNESQFLAMEAEIKEMEKAQRKHELGALLFQVWPETMAMEGRFVPSELVVKIIKILRQK